MVSTPKVVYQTWKSKTTLPSDLEPYVEDWKRLHPDYQHVLLDDADLRSIVAQVVSPSDLEQYDSFTHNIERVDFARYALLYLNGGVYADLDIKPLRKIDKWTSRNKIVLGCEPTKHAHELYGRDRVVCNAIMFSPPSQPFWKDLMNYILSKYEHRYKPVENTGPMAITHFLEGPGKKYEKELIITEPCVFYPLQGDKTISPECGDLSKSDVVHIWANTWTPNWYTDPMWFNSRYMFWVFFILYVIVISYLLLKK